MKTQVLKTVEAEQILLDLSKVLAVLNLAANLTMVTSIYTYNK